jgi:hypothetical protein
MFNLDPPFIAAVLRLRSRNGRERVLVVLLPGLDYTLFPIADLLSFHGAIIPYHPEALLDTKFYLAKMWRATHRTSSSERR